MMKKKVLLLIAVLVVAILLTGCGKEKPKSRRTREKVEDVFQAEEYEGQWKSSEEGKEADYVIIKEVDANLISFEYMLVSAEPNYYVANIKVDSILLNKEGKGEFTFDDDSWNHKGKGTIELSKAGVKITILESESTLEDEEDENGWGIASGSFNEKHTVDG